MQFRPHQMTRAHFTYKATVNGYTVYYKGITINHVMVKSRRGPITKHENSTQFYTEAAKYEINCLVSGFGKRNYLDTIHQLKHNRAGLNAATT